MAKRDKLYTVNKWNKPLLEEERRRKLYLGGGNKNTPYGFNPYLHTGLDQALQTAGLYHGWGNDYQTPAEKNAASNQLITNSDYRGNYNPVMNQIRTYAALPDTDQTPSGEKQIEAGSLPQDTVRPGSALDKFADFASTMTKSINTVKAAKDATNAAAGTVMSERLMSQLPTPSWTTTTDLAQKVLDLYSKSPRLGKELLNTSLAQQRTNFTNKLAELSTLKLPQNTGGLNNLKLSVGSGAKGTNFLNTGFGKGVVMGGADLATDILGSRISPKLNNTKEAQIGNAIGKVGSAVGSGLVATGYALPVGLAVLGAGKLIGGLVKQFGSVKNDNGTSAYINRLNSSNPQGSNEFLANLWANTEYGPTATYTDGAFTDSGKNWARERNEAVANAYDDYQRKIRHALYNNDIMQLQNAYNDNTWSAMGGKLNRKKCNCKAEGGILNTSINPVSAAGYDILSTYLTTQAMKNQASQDAGSSIGNSFMGTDTGTLFANGGNIHINPAHKGEFTAKAKRHGMGVQQFANYVLAHKDKFPTSTVRQAVFAKNSHTWKKAFGGKLNYGKDKDIRDNSFFNEPTLFALGGVYQAGGSNWGNVTEIGAGGQHETNPYQGVQVGVDPEGTPNLVEENEVIWNDYVFSDRIECPKEVCRGLRIGVKKDGYTFAEAAKRLLVESKERPNDPISKKAVAANMQKLEDAQEAVKQKMEADKAVEQFNSLPPEQQVALMQQEGAKAQDAVAQEQMAQEFQSLPPEQQQAIAQQLMAEQAAAQGMPQGGSPEEQAMMQQQMMQQQGAQQYQPQGINPQEALAQASAMQQQALNGAAFGGRLFAEGGMIPQEQPTEQPTEQATEQVDSEMARYSDEELQEIINEYEEAANGEKKVTKGRLARLKKKAERAERELERRNSEGKGAEQEQSDSAEGQPQEPTQEQIQTAAQAQAQQQMMEGQPQQGVPQEGMSPEQAIMMQQQMGQQMSPEEMAAMQQQGGQQYAYGGKLYLTGGDLLSRFGFPTISAAEKVGWRPNMFGLSDWSEDVDMSVLRALVQNEKAEWMKPEHQTKEWIPNDNYRRAVSDFGYDMTNPVLTPENYIYYEPGSNGNRGIADYTNSLDWRSIYGSDKDPDENTVIQKEEDFNRIKAAYPYALANLEWDGEPMTLGRIDKAIKSSNDWKKTQEYLWDPENGLNRRLEYMAMIAPNNEEKGKLRDKFSAKNIYKFEKGADGKYKVTRRTDVDNIDKAERDWWNNVTSDYKYGDMYNTKHFPGSRDIFIDQDTGERLSGRPTADSGYTLVGSPFSSYVAAEKEGDPDYNQNIYFYKKSGNNAGKSTDGKSGNSNLKVVRTDRGIDPVGLGFAVAPGIAGLLGQVIQGPPDTSGIDAAVSFTDNSTGMMVPPHLTHGLMTPAIVDPRITHNTLHSARLGTNRLLANTGSTPSKQASILVNDVNYQSQMGQHDLRDWLANRDQEQKADTFNENVARANAQFLNQADQFNAQMLANARDKSAQMRYNAEIEKLDRRNAWNAGLLANIGNTLEGAYNYWRENQNRQDRDRYASILFPMNDDYAKAYGISYVDPETGLVKRGYNSDMYYGLDSNGKPIFSTNPIVPSGTVTTGACGGKLRKKRKGYTF